MTWCTDIYAPHSYGDWLIARQFSSTLFNLVDSMIFWQSVGCSLREMLMCEPYVMTIILFFVSTLMRCHSYVPIDLHVSNSLRSTSSWTMFPFILELLFGPLKVFAVHFTFPFCHWISQEIVEIFWCGWGCLCWFLPLKWSAFSIGNPTIGFHFGCIQISISSDAHSFVYDVIKIHELTHAKNEGAAIPVVKHKRAQNSVLLNYWKWFVSSSSNFSPIDE